MSVPSIREDLPAPPALARLEALQWLLLALLTMMALHLLVPMARVVPREWFWSGVALALLGLLLSNRASVRLRRAGTALETERAPTLLLTDGVFALSRNPIYLGMLMLLAGEALMLGTLGALLPWPVLLLVLRVGFVRPEERRLRALFGERYATYQRRARRWL